MKKIFTVAFTFLILILVTNVNTSAQDHKFTVKINPLAAGGGPFWVTVVPVTGEYKVQFEVATTAKQSVQIGASLLGPSLILNMDELASDSESGASGIKTSGFRVTGAYKFFLTSDLSAPEGFYVGPYFSYASATIENKDNAGDHISATKMNINGIIGYQMISSGGFVMDIFTGLGYRKTNWEFSADESGFDLGNFKGKGGIGLALGLSFGLAF